MGNYSVLFIFYCKLNTHTPTAQKGGTTMSRHKSTMSEALKEEIAKELGVYNTVSSEGWGAVTSRDCGNMVKKAIEMAERSVNQ